MKAEILFRNSKGSSWMNVCPAREGLGRRYINQGPFQRRFSLANGGLPQYLIRRFKPSRSQDSILTLVTAVYSKCKALIIKHKYNFRDRDKRDKRDNRDGSDRRDNFCPCPVCLFRLYCLFCFKSFMSFKSFFIF